MDTKGGKQGGGGGSGGVMDWDFGIDMYTLICIKRIRTCCIKIKYKKKKENI